MTRAVVYELNAHHAACQPCRVLKIAAQPDERYWIDPDHMCPVGRVLYRRWWEFCYDRPYPVSLEAALLTPVPME